MLKNIVADLMIIVGVLLLVAGLLYVMDGDDLLNKDFNDKTEKVNAVLNNNLYSNLKLWDKYYRRENQIKSSLYKVNFDWKDAIHLNDEINENLKKAIFQNDSQVNSEDEKTKVVIKSGLSSSKIADILSEKGIVEKERFIRTLIIFDAEKKLSSGVYSFNKDADILDVFSKILVGGGE